MKKLLFLCGTIFSLLICSDVFAKESLKGDLKPIVYLGEFEDNNIEEYRLSDDVSLFSAKPDWAENGSKFYYNYLGQQDDGKKYQKFYMKIYNAMNDYLYNSKAKTIKNNSRRFIYINITGFRDMDFGTKREDGTYENDNLDIYNIYNAVIQDNPQFFYRGDAFITVTDKSTGLWYFGVQIDNAYVDNSAKIAEADAITSGIAEYDELINVNMSNYVIEKKIHDKLILDNKYGGSKNEKDAVYTHSIAGSLNKEYGGGVCESYARTMQILLNRYNVPCYYIAGKAGNEGHAWNMIQLDNGEFYCTDSTWDDPLSTYGILRYTYFNMPYSKFYANRNNCYTYLCSNIPECSEDEIYYSKDTDSFKSETVTNYKGEINYVGIAADVSEEETRVVAEGSSETTTKSPAYEYSTEKTTTAFQPIASHTIKPIKIKNEKGKWKLGKFSGQTDKVAYSTEDGAEMSVTVDEDTYISFQTQLTDGGKFVVYIDNVEVLQTSYTYSSSYYIDVPNGCHKVRWKYIKENGTMGILYNVKAVSKGDANSDGKVDLTDLIYIMSEEELDNIDSDICDMDGDNVLASDDMAMILKKISGIDY